jgi:UbiD family decarboxylase
MAYRDMREWIDRLEKEGELVRVKTKVDWNLEVGGINQEIFDRQGPAVLFENVKDHETTLCRKLLTASLSTYPRIALAMGLPKETSIMDLIRVYRERARNPVKPKVVETGPVKEIILKGEEVDLFQFPVPKWHDRDGGRYIGTFDGVITKDPETGWVNVGLYRRMIHDRNHTGITIAHAADNWRHWRKYRKMGAKTMPIAVAVGWDPVLPFVAGHPIAAGTCEYDVMGALRGEPVELVRCETNDLLVPSSAEIVFEGEISLDLNSFRTEGPFGEYYGYYGSMPSRKPVVTWNCITCRKDPIYQGTLEGMPVNESDTATIIGVSANLWDYMDKQITGVKAVYLEPAGLTLIIQIDNSYLGQVYQAATAALTHRITSMYGKNIMVVDEDVDPTDPNQIMWAFGTRVYPPRDIIHVPGVTLPMDPSVHPKDRATLPGGESHIPTTRLIIDATKFVGNPRSDLLFGEKFSPVCYPDKETMKLVRERWKEYGIPVKH